MFKSLAKRGISIEHLNAAARDEGKIVNASDGASGPGIYFVGAGKSEFLGSNPQPTVFVDPSGMINVYADNSQPTSYLDPYGKFRDLSGRGSDDGFLSLVEPGFYSDVYCSGQYNGMSWCYRPPEIKVNAGDVMAGPVGAARAARPAGTLLKRAWDGCSGAAKRIFGRGGGSTAAKDAAIGFSDDAVASAYQGMRSGGGHAIRHLIDEGLIPNSGSLVSRVKSSRTSLPRF